MTSQDCLTILKRKLKVKKVGHTGTLDPIATGLMVVLINEATKLSSFILNTDKTYFATMQLFIRTDTDDISGKVLETRPPFVISQESLNRVFNFYDNSEYEQVVPLYSAVKKDGLKLYQYARQNKPVELPKRLVTIKRLRIISVKENLIQFQLTCSKGTYVRSLIKDIAQDLKTIATMASLRRVEQGAFRIQDAVLLDDIVDEKSIKNKMIPIVKGLKDSLKIVTITNKSMITKIKNGQAINLPNLEIKKEILLVNNNKQPLAIYANSEGTTYISKKGFNIDENDNS